MTRDWILRVGNGKNILNSSKYRIWGIDSTTNHSKHFIKHVKTGDRLWFVKNNSKGKIIAVASYRSHNTREIGPLLTISMTNEQLGWTNEGPDWTSDTEIHYTHFYQVDKCELLTHIKTRSTICKYNEKCRVNLPLEYSYILRYSKVIIK